MVTGLSFKSKINFIDSTHFQHMKKGTRIDMGSFSECIKKADEIYTENVRTCTAGILIDTENFDAVGFHYYDSEGNFSIIGNFIDLVFRKLKKPDKCFILGGKTLKNSPFSMKQFLKIKDIISSRVDKMTYFQEHIFPWSETDLHYSLVNDVLNIHSMYRSVDYKEHPVVSEDEINKCFKEVKLSDDDKIVFNYGVRHDDCLIV